MIYYFDKSSIYIQLSSKIYPHIFAILFKAMSRPFAIFATKINLVKANINVSKVRFGYI